MIRKIETLIVGGGQAGLATSYYLTQRRRERLVLEQAAQMGNVWRNYRWDSFALLTPNWTVKMPGAEYHGDDPDGFLERDQIVAYFEQYTDRFNLPVQYNTRVSSVERKADGTGYRVTTNDASYEAAHVVIATGLYQSPKIPAVGDSLPARITQLHSSEYRNPPSLPVGAILVVGTAQSGCQIAEELYQSSRQVYLSVSRAPRVPRRYRGRDSFEWLNLTGFFDRTPDKLPSPKAKFGANPQVSGKGGGHSLNLHQFARDGVTLLGHLQGVQDDIVTLALDLKESLAKTDKSEAELVKMIDGFIAKNAIDAPPETLPELRDGYDVEERRELNLKAAGINTIIWATGYQFDFSLVKLPIFDEDGFPIQKRGVTDYAGLYFIGLPWLYRQKSGLMLGVGEDAEFIASHITPRA